MYHTIILMKYYYNLICPLCLHKLRLKANIVPTVFMYIFVHKIMVFELLFSFYFYKRFTSNPNLHLLMSFRTLTKHIVHFSHLIYLSI